MRGRVGSTNKMKSNKVGYELHAGRMGLIAYWSPNRHANRQA